MKQLICYMYEYVEYKQMKNVGFIKCMVHKNKVVFQIHGKGLKCNEQNQLEMFLFTKKEERDEFDNAGLVEGSQGRVSYMITIEGLDEEKLLNYDGILLEGAHNIRYVATWRQGEIQLGSRNCNQVECVWNGGELEDHNHQNRSCEREKANQENLGCCEVERGNREEVVCCEIERADKIERDDQEELGCCERERENRGNLECCEIERKNQEEVVCCEGEMESRREVADCEATEYITLESEEEPEIIYRSVERDEIANLSQREWRLANNNFLLHGYSNYKHLMFIRNKGHLYLGIPGIYCKKEATAAKSFGFPIFHPADAQNLGLQEAEYKEDENFGYWCRMVTERNR